MPLLFWIALAGAAGTSARYLVSLWAIERLPLHLPYGTMIVNLTGCFAVSIVMQLATMQSWPATVRLAIVTGFLGGFTTYSTFNYETIRLLETDAPAAFANVAITVLGGLAAGWLGLVLARSLT